MPARYSSLGYSSDSAIADRLANSKYDNVKIVADAIASIETLSTAIESGQLDDVTNLIEPIETLTSILPSIPQIIDNLQGIELIGTDLLSTNSSILDVAANLSKLTTLYTNLEALKYLYDQYSTVSAVHAELGKIISIYNDKPQIDGLHTKLQSVANIGTFETNVGAVAPYVNQIDLVSDNLQYIQAVGTIANIANIVTVANDLNSLDINGIADITVVANDLVSPTSKIIETSSHYTAIEKVANQIDSGVLQDAADVKNLTVEYNAVVSTVPSSLVYDQVENRMIFTIPAATDGEDGQTPIISFSYDDNTGLLSYNVDYIVGPGVPVGEW